MLGTHNAREGTVSLHLSIMYAFCIHCFFLGIALHGADIGGGGEGDLQDLSGVLEQPCG